MLGRFEGVEEEGRLPEDGLDVVRRDLGDGRGHAEGPGVVEGGLDVVVGEVGVVWVVVGVSWL